MSERSKRLGGQIFITSTPEKGTIIRVELPIEQIQIPKPVSGQTDYEESLTDPDISC
jgi:signal transduction histidine kinase